MRRGCAPLLTPHARATDIILLGPPTFGEFGLYEWAVVSDPFELSLFVLARDVKTFFTRYNATVFSELERIGFNRLLNHPRQTVQDGCAPYSETDLWTCVRRGRGCADHC